MVRDGGSLQASFVGSNGSQYCLFLELISEARPAGRLVRLGYEQPVVFERVEIREANRIGWEAINQVDMSWAHALALLNQLKSLTEHESHSKWLAVMQEVVKAQGKIPCSIQTTLEWLTSPDQIPQK